MNHRKAVFLKCYGVLTPDMMVGGLIDMGVPPVYLFSCLKEAGRTETFIEQANPKAQISAHYFRIPKAEGSFRSKEDLLRLWQSLTEKKQNDWTEKGMKVFSVLFAALPEGKEPGDYGIGGEDVLSLYLFLAALDYLDAEIFFTVPFEKGEGSTLPGKLSAEILQDAVSTQGNPVPADGIAPFAAAMLEGLSEEFLPMDGRFLVDKTAYGSASVEKPDGENTAAEYLGYFHEKETSILGKRIRIFGEDTDLF